MEEKIKIDSLRDDEIDLIDLFRALWLDKLKISVITTIFAITSVFYALYLPNIYKAEILLVPVESNNNAISGALGQLGGLAGLAGVNISSGETSEVDIAVHIAKSWGFISEFIIDNGLNAEVFAVTGWDQETNELIYNEDIYNPSTKEWLLESGPPNEFQLFSSFEGKKEIVVNKMTGLVTVSVDSYSPYLAKRWLDLYIIRINEYMQTRRVNELKRNIEFLEIQLEKNDNKDMQRVLYSFIGEQIKNKMLTEASPEYVFTSAGPSLLPQKKYSPYRAMICIWGTTLGLLFSILFSLSRYLIRSRYKKS